MGDINLSAVNTSTVDADSDPNGDLFHFGVTLNADGGNEAITIGDISVSGDGTLDNLGALFDLGPIDGWLNTNGSTDVTVGDIDYSGYDGDAVLYLAGVEGAANITAAAGDTEITVNDTENLITLGGGDDTVRYEAVEDSGTTYADIDKISGFDSGSDEIDFSWFNNNTSMGTSEGIGGTVANYDAFVVAAASAIDNEGYDLFTMYAGGNTYVAVDTDGDDEIDFAIELTGVTNVSVADFVLGISA